MAPGLLGWVFETFVATTLLMVLVLLIRNPVRKAFGPGMAYALWLLPVARLLLPPLPESWREQAAAPVAAMSDAITWYVVDAGEGPVEAAAAAAPSSIDWLLVVAALWAVGAVGFLAYHLIAHSRYCAKLLRRARIDRTVAEGKVRVIETDAAHGPLAFGIWRKYVAFPRDFSERYDEQERALALAHELGHHVRGDLIANWVALFVLALHWFNPVAWRAFRAFRADQEMACDALVLAGREQALRHAYGRAIVKSAHGGAVSAACHLHTINEVKGRLRMLSKTHKHSTLRLLVGTLGVGGISAVALGLTASGSQAAEGITAKVEAATGIALTQDAPPPPKAPDAPEAQDAPAAPDAPKVERRVYRIVTSDSHGPHKKGGKERRVMVLEPHGDMTVDIPSEAELRAMVPDVKEGNCKEGEGGNAMVWHSEDKGKKKVIVCVNRIHVVTGEAAKARAHAGEARVMAFRSADFGRRSALMGLRHARKAIEGDGTLSPDKKREALKGIDSAIGEIERESKDKD